MQHDIASIYHFALVYPRLVKTIRTLTDPRSLLDSRGCCCLTEFRGVFPRSVMSQWQKQIRKVNIELRTLCEAAAAPGGTAMRDTGGGRRVVSSLTFVLSKLSQVCPSQFNSALLMCCLLGRRIFASYLNH